MDDLRRDPSLAERFLDELGDEITYQLVTDWAFLARDEQLPPTDDYKFWLYMAGRGSGKTRTGAEWTKDLIRKGYNRGGLIAPTAADVRDVMVEGESGLLAVCQAWDRDYLGNLMGRPIYEPSKRRVTWENGAMVTLYSADEPERLRGPQHSFLWMDELAAWRYMDTFDQAMFGLRLGKSPKVFISTTPKPKPLVKKLYARALDPNDREVVMTTGSSERNSANLAPGVIEELRNMYAGTSLGRQELDGVLLEEIDGALWSRKIIDRYRIEVMPTLLDPAFYFTRIVVGVDPATTDKEGSDETGIVVVGLGSDKHAYVLADYSGKYSPQAWGEKVSYAFALWQADMVVAEVNQGGDMVKHILNAINPSMTIKTVHASRGKMARAEPVAQKYEQGKVHHVGRPILDANGLKKEGHLDNLEDQMCTWERLSATYSPDRIDALVWCITELMISGQKAIVTSRLRGTH
ncbi:terminase large subunit [Pseudanabaena phage Pan1]|nr:terminase large subunit [Pseudanabaena phage Pan1]